MHGRLHAVLSFTIVELLIKLARSMVCSMQLLQACRALEGKAFMLSCCAAPLPELHSHCEPNPLSLPPSNMPAPHVSWPDPRQWYSWTWLKAHLAKAAVDEDEDDGWCGSQGAMTQESQP